MLTNKWFYLLEEIANLQTYSFYFVGIKIIIIKSKSDRIDYCPGLKRLMIFFLIISSGVDFRVLLKKEKEKYFLL